MKILTVALAAAICTSCLVPTASATPDHRTLKHGSMCNPATLDLTRTTYGLRNNTTGNRSVYCGFEVREAGSTGYYLIGVTLRNYASVERSITCYWSSGQPYTGGYATTTTVLTLPANGGLPDVTYGDSLSRPNSYATLGVRCALPPGVAIDLVEAYASDPPV
jgi:hypothetical protein